MTTASVEAVEVLVTWTYGAAVAAAGSDAGVAAAWLAADVEPSA